MAQSQQEEGWPLGLQNARVGLSSNSHHYSGSISFNTTLTGSPSSSTDFSSDLDTESTGSFFHDKSITLGSLIGVKSILEFSRRSLRGRRSVSTKEKLRSTNTTTTTNKSLKRLWLFSLCSKDSTDANNVDKINNNNHPPSLGHFLAVERRTATESRRNPNPLASPTVLGPDELGLAQPGMESNSLFVNGCIAPPPQSSPSAIQNEGKSKNMMKFENLLSCLCAQPSH